MFKRIFAKNFLNIFNLQLFFFQILWFKCDQMADLFSIPVGYNPRSVIGPSGSSTGLEYLGEYLFGIEPSIV